MTLPYSPSRAVYQGNGAATAFPFAFKVWSTDQLSVSLTSPEGRTSPAQGWSASLGESGGTVTYLHSSAPLPAGWRLAIVRDMPLAQGIDLVSASRFDPQVIEDGLDQATAELQQLNEKITRAILLPATSDQSPEDVVQAIYASRDAAAASASAASTQAAAAQASAEAAASGANIAVQTVQAAAEEAVAKAAVQANAAANSAVAAAQSATLAEAASGGLAPRMEAAEQKNIQQDTRLDAVELKNTQQDGRLTSTESSLAGKANADLSNITVNAINYHLHVCDEKTSGTGGGATSGNTWHTRDLNTIRVNRINATLANNRITLPAGRYYIRAHIPVMAANAAKAALYDTTNAAYLAYSPPTYTDFTGAVCGVLQVEREITLLSTTTIELRMWAQSAYGNGMGRAASIAGVPETYAEVHIWKM